MEMRLTFILGGARSGKSAHAVKLAAERGERVLYVATAEPGDPEMAARIAAHRRQRPAAWRTLEAPRDTGRAIREARGPEDVIVLDCLTLLASNVVVGLGEDASAEAGVAALDRELDDILDAFREGKAGWIVVSNEVGLGLVPPYPLGRSFRDALGRANARMAAAADEVLFLIAGLPLRLK